MLRQRDDLFNVNREKKEAKKQQKFDRIVETEAEPDQAPDPKCDDLDYKLEFRQSVMEAFVAQI